MKIKKLNGLQTLRHRLNLNQLELAEYLQVDRVSLAQAEKDRRELPERCQTRYQLLANCLYANTADIKSVAKSQLLRADSDSKRLQTFTIEQSKHKISLLEHKLKGIEVRYAEAMDAVVRMERFNFSKVLGYSIETKEWLGYFVGKSRLLLEQNSPTEQMKIKIKLAELRGIVAFLK